jgi:hypothetical protein
MAARLLEATAANQTATTKALLVPRRTVNSRHMVIQASGPAHQATTSNRQAASLKAVCLASYSERASRINNSSSRSMDIPSNSSKVIRHSSRTVMLHSRGTMDRVGIHLSSMRNLGVSQGWELEAQRRWV